MATQKVITEPASTASGAEWTRLPRVGETVEGLYRSQLFALMRSGQIRTAAIKQPGAARTGMRLIHIPSVRAWIECHASGGEGLKP